MPSRDFVLCCLSLRWVGEPLGPSDKIWPSCWLFCLRLMPAFEVLFVEGLVECMLSSSAARAATFLLLLDEASFPMPFDTASAPEPFDSGGRLDGLGRGVTAV